MASTLTIYSDSCKHGYLSSAGFDYTSDCIFGEESGHDYSGYIRFAPLAIPDAVIQSVQLVLKRNDTLGSRTFTFGINQSAVWGASMLSTYSAYISSGSGTKTIDLTSQKDLIQSFTSTWYVRTNVNRGNSIGIVKCYGDEDGTNAPKLIVNYENATVEYYMDGGWQKCLVYYRNSSGIWVQCIPYYYKDGAWVRV